MHCSQYIITPALVTWLILVSWMTYSNYHCREEKAQKDRKQL